MEIELPELKARAAEVVRVASLMSGEFLFAGLAIVTLLVSQLSEKAAAALQRLALKLREKRTGKATPVPKTEGGMALSEEEIVEAPGSQGADEGEEQSQEGNTQCHSRGQSQEAETRSAKPRSKVEDDEGYCEDVGALEEAVRDKCDISNGVQELLDSPDPLEESQPPKVQAC